MIWFLNLWALICIGLIGLACGMPKHQKQIFKHELTAKKTYIAQISGWLLLALSLLSAIRPSQLSIGICYWLGALSLSALFMAWCLSYFERYFKYIGLVLTSIFLLTCIALFI